MGSSPRTNAGMDVIGLLRHWWARGHTGERPVSSENVSAGRGNIHVRCACCGDASLSSAPKLKVQKADPSQMMFCPRPGNSSICQYRGSAYTVGGGQRSKGYLCTADVALLEHFLPGQTKQIPVLVSVPTAESFNWLEPHKY